MGPAGRANVSPQDQAEQGPGADCLQRPLVPRSRFRQQLRPGVRLLTLHCMHGLKNVAYYVYYFGSCEGQGAVSKHWGSYAGV